jgi:nucleoside-diphosphate-sugar epimerase
MLVDIVKTAKDKKFLILGASGFLGKHLVKELRRLGFTNENIFYPKSSTETNLLFLNEMRYGIFDNKYLM